MKTKQEQIEKIAKIIDEMYWVYDTTADDIAEGLYNAGYRKAQDVGEYKNRFEIADKVLTETRAKLAKAEHDRDRYKAEIERLKAENDCLLKACEGQFTFDTTENKNIAFSTLLEKNLRKI